MGQHSCHTFLISSRLFPERQKSFDKLRHVGHICGKEDTHLKKQTSKQKQEEDRKSIEKIKCSFWLENLRNFESLRR